MNVPTTSQIRDLAPWLGLAGVVAFLAALLGVQLSGPGKQLEDLEPRVRTIEEKVELFEGLIVAECLDSEKRARLIRARVPCYTLLRDAGVE